jgi:hypothetical protein
VFFAVIHAEIKHSDLSRQGTSDHSGLPLTKPSLKSFTSCAVPIDFLPQRMNLAFQLFKLLLLAL